MSDSLTIRHADTVERNPNLDLPDPHQDAFSRTTLGFWIYLMTDCLVFTTLFTTYAVLHNSTFGGPSSQDIFSLTTSFAETMILLFSSVMCGLAMLSAVRGNKRQTIGWLALTFAFGACFIAMEIQEFSHLVAEGHSWTRSAFLSSFFTLVGTHGLHVSTGMLWMIVIMLQVHFTGITATTFRRLVVFSLFWHFLDLVWIFIFTFVYLMGVVV